MINIYCYFDESHRILVFPIYFSVEGIKIIIDKVICVKENLAWEVITGVEFVYVMLQSSLIIRGI